MSDKVKVREIPNCDVCRFAVPAFADAKIPGGPWGYVCESHFRDFGCSLGLGRGQRLVLE